jgi:hypothetical protein
LNYFFHYLAKPRDPLHLLRSAAQNFLDRFEQQQGSKIFRKEFLPTLKALSALTVVAPFARITESMNFKPCSSFQLLSPLNKTSHLSIG